jgi:predicted PurR-regulated permease PerM
MSEKKPHRLQIDISTSAIVKVLLAAVFVYLFLHLAAVLMLLFLSVLIAVAMEPSIRWIERFAPRWAGILALAIFFGAILFFVLLNLVPVLIEQVSVVIEKLPFFLKALMSGSAPNSIFHRIGEKIFQNPDLPDLSTSLGQLMVVGQFAIGGISSLCLIFAFVIYLSLDGRRLYHWLLCFFKAEIRRKIEATVPEVSKMISAYVIGQSFASLLCGAYVYVLATAMNVPAALMLAVIAAVCDVLPIVGFYIGLIPISIFALTASPTTMFIVAGLYWAYHLIEGYFILPKIYSKRLRLSGLAVLLAILCGLTIAGVLGAIAILPIVASYPVIEHIWLSHYLGREVIVNHDRMTDLTT